MERNDEVRSRSNASGSIWQGEGGVPHVRESPTIYALRRSSYMGRDHADIDHIDPLQLGIRRKQTLYLVYIVKTIQSEGTTISVL